MKKILLISVMVVLVISTSYAQLPTNLSARMYHYYEKDTPAGVSQNTDAPVQVSIQSLEGFIEVKTMGDAQLSKVEIYNMAGSLVLSEKVEGMVSLIPAQTLAKGAYIIRVYLSNALASGVIYKS